MTRKKHRDVWVGIVLLVFSLWALFNARGIKGEAKILPVALTVMMTVCAALILLKGFRKTREQNGEYRYALTIAGSKNAFRYMLFIFLYFGAFYLLSYWIATPVFLFLSMKHLKLKSWKVNLVITVLYTVICYVVFVVILKLPIYKIGIFGKYFRYV